MKQNLDEATNKFAALVEVLIGEIAQLEKTIVEKKNKVTSEVLVAASTQLTSDQKLALARWLYSSQSFIKQSYLLEHLELVVKCDKCGNDIQIKTKTELEHLRDAKHFVKNSFTDKLGNFQFTFFGYDKICKACFKKLPEERNSPEARKELIELLRKDTEFYANLMRMPYKEYLQTPVWQQRREVHLKKAHYRCQVCNSADKILDVHHRTYERRGNELPSDLTVLCRDCHYLFHDKLPKDETG